MTNNETQAIKFDEDTFDLTEHRKAADTVCREKARVRRIRRQLALGKIFLAIAAFAIFLLLYYIAANTIGIF